MHSMTISVRARPVAVFCGLLVLAVSAPSSRAQEVSPGRVIIPADATYTQRASGMEFPPAVGDFRRVEIRRYDEAGTDESVGYNFVAGDAGIAATVYVYPVPPGVASDARDEATLREFESRKDEIAYVHPAAELLQEDATALIQDGTTFRGHKVVYGFEHLFAGKLQPLRSELHLFGFVGGKWFVKYRFSYPVAMPAAERIQRFMRELEITIAGAR